MGAVAQLEVVSSKISLRWRLKIFHPWQFEATVEYVEGQDEVSVKPATLERKDIQATKPVIVWQLYHTIGHTCGQALYALHQDDVSS